MNKMNNKFLQKGGFEHWGKVGVFFLVSFICIAILIGIY